MPLPPFPNLRCGSMNANIYFPPNRRTKANAPANHSHLPPAALANFVRFSAPTQNTVLRGRKAYFRWKLKNNNHRQLYQRSNKAPPRTKGTTNSNIWSHGITYRFGPSRPRFACFRVPSTVGKAFPHKKMTPETTRPAPWLHTRATFLLLFH